jgi:hypothetical protein
MAIRVQGPSGSSNARWRRESGGGNTDPPEADRLRGSAEKADHEKLNDERGVKPLPVSGSRDGAESGKACPGWVGVPLLYSGPRNQESIHWKLCRGGSLGHTGQAGTSGPTNVTAAVKNQTNRARSVAAGVVSGAGQSAGASNAAL